MDISSSLQKLVVEIETSLTEGVLVICRVELRQQPRMKFFFEEVAALSTSMSVVESEQTAAIDVLVHQTLESEITDRPTVVVR